MINRIRLFPALAVSAALLGGIKAIGVVQGLNDIVPPVKAADAVPSAETSAADPVTTGPDGDATSDTGTDTDTKAADTDSAKLQPDSDGLYSPAELQLLQSLSVRRSELDKREKDLDMREQVLKVAEKRVDEKLVKIKKIQDDINASLKTYDDKENAQLDSIVKVYQQMKPADAARIMSTLDMKVLIEVAQRMSERKIAPIMASMDPATAKKLTMELATRQPLAAESADNTATQ